MSWKTRTTSTKAGGKEIDVDMIQIGDIIARIFKASQVEEVKEGSVYLPRQICTQLAAWKRKSSCQALIQRSMVPRAHTRIRDYAHVQELHLV